MPPTQRNVLEGRESPEGRQQRHWRPSAKQAYQLQEKAIAAERRIENAERRECALVRIAVERDVALPRLFEIHQVVRVSARRMSVMSIEASITSFIESYSLIFVTDIYAPVSPVAGSSRQVLENLDSDDDLDDTNLRAFDEDDEDDQDGGEDIALHPAEDFDELSDDNRGDGGISRKPIRIARGSSGRPRAKDWDDETQQVIEIAVALYRVKISCLDTFPRSSLEPEWARDCWEKACLDTELDIQLIPDITKLASTSIVSERHDRLTAMLIADKPGLAAPRHSQHKAAVRQNRHRAEALLENKTYIFQRVEGTVRKGLYQHLIIQKAVNDTWFKNKKDEGVVYHELFDPFPVVGIALILTAIENAIMEWNTGIRADDTFKQEVYEETYRKHLQALAEFDTHSKGVLIKIQSKLHGNGCPVTQQSPRFVTAEEMDAAIEEYDDNADRLFSDSYTAIVFYEPACKTIKGMNHNANVPVHQCKRCPSGQYLLEWPWYNSARVSTWFPIYLRPSLVHKPNASIADNIVRQLHYVYPSTGRSQTSLSKCPLSTNSAIPCQDFTFYNARNLTDVQVTLAELQSASPARIANPTSHRLSQSPRNGTWTELDANTNIAATQQSVLVSTHAVGTSPPQDPSFTWMPYVLASRMRFDFGRPPRPSLPSRTIPPAPILLSGTFGLPSTKARIIVMCRNGALAFLSNGGLNRPVTSLVFDGDKPFVGCPLSDTPAGSNSGSLRGIAMSSYLIQQL
ncbi:hypothetical protein EVG20_g7944 [Dentipellis fragilis]|uniref:DUF6532 domain-containing protein n=1 Tax=Dentipellis fragilis TaxID=205917 RepID=A0A4Y9YAU9_9AGAM|nr:hypothetical protein EVG20_g7944 [Dentipellis fragilis]